MQTLVHERVCAAVKKSGFKQKFIAEHIGVSEQTFVAMLNGTRKISVDEFFGLCGILDMSPNELYGFNPVASKGAV